MEVVKGAQRLCVSIPRQYCTIVIDFQESRDYNVTVCMLGRFGFTIMEQPTASVDQKPRSPAITPSAEERSGFGAGLSSITPMPGLDLARSNQRSPLHHGRTLTGLTLGGDASASTSTAPGYIPTTGHSAPISGASQTPVSSSAVQLSHLNPYNVFAGISHVDNYRPRISSPLRNSFDASGTPYNLEATGYLHYPAESSSVGRSPSDLSQVNHLSHHFSLSTSPATSQEHYISDSQSPVWRELDEWSLRTDPAHANNSFSGGFNDGKKHKAKNEFSKLLPQPRELPFRPTPSKGDSVESQVLQISGTEDASPRTPHPIAPRARSKEPMKREANLNKRTVAKRSALEQNKDDNTPKEKKRGRDGDGEDTASYDDQRKVRLNLRSATRSSAAKELEVPDRMECSAVSSVRKSNTQNNNPKHQKRSIACKPHVNPTKISSQRARKESSGHANVDKHNGQAGVSSQHPSPRRTRSQRRLNEGCEPVGKGPGKSKQRQPRTLTMGRNQSRATATSLSASPFRNVEQEGALPVLLITDAMFHGAKEAANVILDQYETDMSSGADAGSSAQYYLDQLTRVRTNYWYMKLLEMEARPWVSQV